MTKGLLLIDDGTEHIGVLTNISDYLRANEQIDISTFHINPLDQPYWDENRDPSMGNVISAVKNKLSTYSPGLIIVDQYYSDVTSFDGILLISKPREISKFKTCPIFLISGKRDKIVRDIFSDNDKSDRDKVNELSKIIGYGINRFLDKTFRDEAIEVLKNKDLNSVFPEKLREYENQDLKIKRFTPKYSEITLSELADYISSGNSEAFNILEEMFELTLSYYVNVNDDLE